MANRKIERALYGPTLWEITLGLLLTVVLGAALAIVVLIFRPVAAVKDLPKENERMRGVVYYAEGSTDYAKAKQWTRKRQALVEGAPGEIAFTEDDLNVWFSSSSAAPAKTPAPKKPAPKPGEKVEEEPAELIAPASLNFRIRDNAVQVGLPTTINVLGFSFPVVAQARGGFVKQGDMFVYIPETLYVGSLPLHKFPGAVDYLINRALTSQALPGELLSAWKKISNVAIDGRTLKLTIL